MTTIPTLQGVELREYGQPEGLEAGHLAELILDNLQSERDALIMRGRHLETVLMKHGRISRRSIIYRQGKE